MLRWKNPLFLTLVVILLSALIAVPQAPAIAQGTLNFSLPPIYGEQTLNGGFIPDPFSVSIQAGGSVSGSYLTDTRGNSCYGNYTSAPTYRLRYNNARSFLRIFIESNTDATLAINMPNGQWLCNDDAFGLNPAIDFEPPISGRYDIFVGTLANTAGASATLKISELRSSQPGGTGINPGPGPGPGPVPGGTLNFSLPPVYGEQTLNGGFIPDPFSVSIQAGGTVSGSYLTDTRGNSCYGNYTSAPTYRLRYNNARSFLRIFAESGSDTTLAINMPNGQWLCNDDTFGLNPAIDFEPPISGRYDIFVGTLANTGGVSATLKISELRSSQPGGTGTNPGPGPGPGPVTGGTLNFSLPPVYGEQTLNGGFIPDPFSVSIQAGGSVNGSFLTDSRGNTCRGNYTSAPTYRLRYNNARSFLRIFAESGSDTTLAINMPNGQWLCNDDTFGRNPAIDFEPPISGRYDIFVGTFGTTGGASATLKISELRSSQPGGTGTNPGPGTGPVTGGLNYGTAPVYGTNNLQGGFLPDPVRTNIAAGGSINGGYLTDVNGNNCRGNYTSAPTLRVRYTNARSFFRIYVTSSVDTTLAINMPNGQWVCNDDRFGLNPGVDFEPPMSGTYDIFVGVLNPNNMGTGATLNITELRNNTQ